MKPHRSQCVQVITAGLVLASALLATGGCRPRTGSSDSSLRPVSYHYTEIKDFLCRQGVEDPYYPIGVRRDPTGTMLFVIFSQKGATGYWGLTVNGHKIDKWRAPAPRCFLSGEGALVAWHVVSANDERLEFQGGQCVVLPKHGAADVDPGGQYFVVTSEPAETWIGRVHSPTDRQLVAADFYGDRVFAASNRVYVCGMTVSGGSPGARTRSTETCYVLEDAGDRFKAVGHLNLPWPAVDMDASDGRLLLCQVRDLPFGASRLWTYNINTGERVRDGSYEGHSALFLTEDSLRGHRKSNGDHPKPEPDTATNRGSTPPSAGSENPQAGHDR